MKDLKSGSLAALTAAVLLAAAAFSPKSDDDTVKAPSAALKTTTDKDHKVANATILALRFFIDGWHDRLKSALVNGEVITSDRKPGTDLANSDRPTRWTSIVEQF